MAKEMSKALEKRCYERYNDIMFECSYEHSTIGTEFSESTDGWNLKDMIDEAEYLLGCYYEPGNIRYDEMLTDKAAFKAWKKETKMLRKWIEDFRPYSIGVEPTAKHLNWFGN